MRRAMATADEQVYTALVKGSAVRKFQVQSIFNDNKITIQGARSLLTHLVDGDFLTVSII